MKVDDIAMTPSNDDLLGDLLGEPLDLAGEDLDWPGHRDAGAA